MKHFVLKIKAIPNSGKFGFLGFDGKELKLSVKSPAKKGRANLEIIQELTKKLNAEITIIKGFKSPKKEILVGIPEKEFLEKLEKLL